MAEWLQFMVISSLLGTREADGCVGATRCDDDEDVCYPKGRRP